MNYPSKKIILLFATAIIVIGGLFYALFFSAQKAVYIAPVVESADRESPVLAKDSDSDGLKDWEEGLWKTDPQNPDTDGDGASDGQEVKDGRNPLVKGPNDKLPTDVAEKKINTETDADLTATDKFSRELFLKIMAAEKTPGSVTEEDFQNFLNSTIQQQLADQNAKAWTAGDFEIDTSENADSVKNYGNEIARILTEKPPKELEYELAIFDRAQTKNDPKELKKLDPLIAQYKKIQSELLKVTVPKSASSFHIALTNGVSGMIYSITGLSHIMTDPIKSLPGVSSYADNAKNFYNSLTQFKSYFIQKGTIFEQGDYGYKFFSEL